MKPLSSLKIVTYLQDPQMVPCLFFCLLLLLLLLCLFGLVCCSCCLGFCFSNQHTIVRRIKIVCLLLSHASTLPSEFLEQIICAFFRDSSALLDKWLLPDLMKRYRKRSSAGQSPYMHQHFYNLTLIYCFSTHPYQRISKCPINEDFCDCNLILYPCIYTFSVMLQHFINMSM